MYVQHNASCRSLCLNSVERSGVEARTYRVRKWSCVHGVFNDRSNELFTSINTCNLHMISQQYTPTMATRRIPNSIQSLLQQHTRLQGAIPHTLHPAMTTEHYQGTEPGPRIHRYISDVYRRIFQHDITTLLLLKAFNTLLPFTLLLRRFHQHSGQWHFQRHH